MSGLSITVTNATNLNNVETFGKSDPYTLIEYQGQKQKTKVIDDNLNPEWNETVAFDLGGKAITAADSLIVKVMDKEKIGPDKLMGTVDVPLTDLASGKTEVQLSLNLLDKNKRATSGYLNLKIKYDGPKQAKQGGGGGGAGGDQVDGGDSDDVEEDIDPVTAGETGSKPRKLKGKVGKRKGVKNYSTKPQDFQVRVKVIEARQIQGGNVSPVCKIRLKNQAKQTKVQKSTSTPCWNANFFFNFHLSAAELFDEMIDFQVFNSRKLRSDALIGSFKFDLSMVYEEPNHAYINRWLLLSDPEDATAGPKGYLKFCICIVGPGDDAPTFSTSSDDSDDIESNLIRPAGLQLRPAIFNLKIYQGEDFPKMDSAVLQGVKKFFTGKETKELVDPYIATSFAGKEIKTTTKYETDHPEWNEELKIALQFPSMCDRLKIQLFDWDVVGNNDAIGYIELHISTMSSSVIDCGFLPTFGPSFINFYGGPREFSDLPDKYEALNLGKGDGVAYRGRVLVELQTEFSESPEPPPENTPISEEHTLRVSKFLRRRKYRLHTAFLQANMIKESDAPIEFEVSMGNYGNKLDDTVPATSSCTQPTNAVYDGLHYYFLPWGDSKPCAVVDCQWEDTTFRLYSSNYFLRIADKLKNDLHRIKVAVDAKIPEEEQAQFIITAFDSLILNTGKPLPEWEAGQSPETELDKNLRLLRQNELDQLRKDAMRIREEATLVEQAVDELECFLVQLNNMAYEPQNSFPDIIIWMLIGGSRKFCTRIPAHDIIWSNNQDCRGRFCGTVQTLNLKGPLLLDEKDVKDLMIPCQLRVKLWLGQEKEESSWHELQKEGKLTVMAETYENQASILGKWTTKSPLMSRPAWSDASGKVEVLKNKVQPPPGWAWDGDWYISPELSLYFDKDSLLTEYVEEVFVCEMRIPGGSWGPSKNPYMDVKGDPCQAPNEFELPDGWEWINDWEVDFNRPVDEEGWEYAVDQSLGDFQPAEKMYHMCRRSRYIRERRQVEKKSKKSKKQDTKGEHWEYAPIFDGKFHTEERKIDMVRRRRWHRMMINSEPGAPCYFNLGAEESGEKTLTAAPRMILKYEKGHKWQLRAYLFQARSLLAADQNGFSDPYARVVFCNQSQLTEVKEKSICPSWDQTLLFKEIEIFSSPKTISENPPKVIIELFDKDKLGEDEFLGRCDAVPLVKLQPSDQRRAVLQWFPLKKGSRDAGELLAAFELYLISEQQLPPLPPRRGNLYLVPDGIRPMMQRTGLEILAWGVRNMKRFQLLKVKTPSVEVEVGGEVLKTPIIKNVEKNPNFDNPALFLDIMLPREELYMPPMNIKVRDHRAFGRKPVVGTFCLKSTDQFRAYPLMSERDPLDDYPQLQEVIISKKTPKEQSAPMDLQTLFEGRKKANLQKIDEDIDWWSKYYASLGKLEKCQKYLEMGYDTMIIHPRELEYCEGYDSFNDFCSTFYLTRGSNDDMDEEEDEFVGEFKGSFRIYPLPDDPEEPMPVKYFESGLPSNENIECVVRVYVIKAYDLQPDDPSGLADPYIKVNIGDNDQSSRDDYIPNSLTPEFGRMFELKATIPVDKDLRVQIIDYDMMSKDDVIGETIIDLENRFLSRYRALCGLPQSYCISGPNQWRDNQTPKVILTEFCARVSLPEPEFGKAEDEKDCLVKIGKKTFRLSQFEEGLIRNEHWGPKEERLSLAVLNKLPFVKEHVEIRSLYSPLQPDIEQGKVEMWVDIHPLSLGPPGPPFSIRPRTPKKYELRIIVWNTYEVKLDEANLLGERMSDIFVKGWINGLDEKQETDVHYRSLDGEGNFNWRFVFPFEYIPSENIMVVKKKEHFWSLDKTEQRLPCGLVLQVWDNDKFSADDFIGTLEMNLNAVPTPAKKKRSCELEQLEQFGGTKFQNLFECKRVKGYWPVYDNTTGTPELTGKLELEMELVTEQESQLRPTARARDDPNENPHLEPPKRPETSFFWLTSPWKSFKFIIWKSMRFYLITGLVIFLVVLLVALFVYAIPSLTARKMMGV